MFAIDIFEADPQAGYVPVNPERPGSKHRKLGNLNLDAIKKSFEQPGEPTPATLQFLNGTSRTLTSAEVDAVADYYDSLKTKVEKANFIYRTFISQDKMSNLLFKLKQLNLDLPPPREPDAGPEQLTLFQEKKSNEDQKYKDVAVQRAMQKAKAEFPSAASDSEAFAKSMMVQQDQDQQSIDRLKTGLGRQRELLKKNNQLDVTQDQTISALNKEIHDVEKDNSNLEQTIQQMQRANAQLQQTLNRMRGKRTEPAPQLGVSVATDKQPTVAAVPQAKQAETPPEFTPIDIGARRQAAAVKKELERLKQQRLVTTQVGGKDAEVQAGSSLKQANLPDRIKNRSFTDVPEKLKREDLTHGLEEGSVFGQQDFDTQMNLAKLKTKLTQPKPAQGAPAAKPQPKPARLSDLQSRREKFANLADIKKEIETLQARATRGGRMLPRGLAADLEDYFTTADVDRDYEEMLAKYQKQLGALQQYLGMRKVLWSPKKATHEDTKSDLYANAIAKIKKALSNPKLDPAVRKDYETRLQKFITEGRAGYNPLVSQQHWYEVERYLASQINDPKLDPESRAEARQRYLEKRKEAQQKGWAK